MSEQTPENMSEREPSMEDILASIRKIIAEDAPAGAGAAKAVSGLDTAIASADVLTRPGADVVASIPAPSIEPEPFDLSAMKDVAIEDESTQDLLDMVEFDLTDDLAMGDESLDLSIADDVSSLDVSGALEVSETELTENLLAETLDTAAHEDVLELTDLAEVETAGDDLDFDVDALLSDFDDTGEDATDDVAASIQAVETPQTPATEDLALDDLDLGDTATSVEMDDDLDALLDDLVADSDLNTVPEVEALDIVPEAETVIDPAADMLADDEGEDILESLGFDDLPEAEFEDSTASAISEDDDIDLVKSLMADLTGENDTDFELESDELVDVIVEEQADDLAGVTATADSAVDTDMDDLSAIIADINADAQDAEARAQNVKEADILDLSVDETAAPIDEPGASGLARLATAASATIAAVGIAAVTSDDEDDVSDIDSDLEALLDDSGLTELEEAEVITEEAASPDPIESDTTEINEEQESDMSATTGREAISSRDTVDDTSSAFASLGKVVEEKAVFQESGPRIGDLVQDALKPMLQEWLDANLKQIVDRAVAKEIKRISSGK